MVMLILRNVNCIATSWVWFCDSEMHMIQLRTLVTTQSLLSC